MGTPILYESHSKMKQKDWVAVFRGLDIEEGLQTHMKCRAQCGACCIALSISSPIPGMPSGKPAGMPCIHLDESYACRIFDQPGRPAVCASLKPNLEMCGSHRDEALAFLFQLEELTAPKSGC